MTRTIAGLVRLSVAGTLAGFAFLWSGELPLAPERSFVSSAHAIIGRPATPMSYAGVARRTTRRAVVVAPVVVAPVVVAPVVVTPVCTQAVDVYGRVYTRC